MSKLLWLETEPNPRPICILLTDLHTETDCVAPTDSMTEWPGMGHFDPAEKAKTIRLALPFLWVTAQDAVPPPPPPLVHHFHTISADAYMSRSIDQVPGDYASASASIAGSQFKVQSLSRELAK